MALIGLEKDTLKLILFGGKGGVGKTTCASSTALYLAKNYKTILISTDPAHSLSDSLSQGIGDEVKEVEGAKNLSALEINAEKAFSKFKMQYGKEIRKILDTSTYLDQEDIDSVFTLSIPGIDEIMGFKVIVDLIEEGRFDKYIVDTAPTGHALRLLTAPEVLDDWIKVMAKMRWKYRYMATTFGGKYTPDEGDDFLVEMKKTVKKIEELLRSRDKCEFIAVTILADMAILETERLIEGLNKHGIKVKRLVVNNVLESGDCQFCREKRSGQGKYVNQIKTKFSSLDTTIVPLQPREIKGLGALKSLEEPLFQPRRWARTVTSEQVDEQIADEKVTSCEVK